jgi:hypothetical protein
MPAEAVAARNLRRWILGLEACAIWTTAMLIVTNLLLVGHLVLDDPLVGTTAFWQARPIRGGRWVAAKLIAGAGMFGVRPVVALAPAWLASGFFAGEWVRAMAEFGAGQAALIVVATTVGALTRSLAQFFFAMLGLAVAYLFALTPVLPMGLGRPGSDAVEYSRIVLTVLAPVPMMAAVLTWQVMTRRAGVAWSTIVAGLFRIYAVRGWWPWVLLALLPTTRSAMAATPATADESRGVVAVRPEVTPEERGSGHVTTVTVEDGPVGNAVFAPEKGVVRLRGPDGRAGNFVLERGARWGEDAAKRCGES